MKNSAVQVHIPYPLLLEKLDYVVKRRLNPEVYLDGAQLDKASRHDLKAIHDAMVFHNLTLTMHGPYEGLSPAGMNEAERLRAVDRIRLAFEAASILRPRTIVLHGGWSEKKHKGDVEAWLALAMKTFSVFIEKAERLGTIICVENIHDRTPDALMALMIAANSPHLRVCIDTGHLNVFSKTTVEAWIDGLGRYIGEAHLHDNDGSSDQHLPIGEGSFDFAVFLGLLKKQSVRPVYTIEPHGEDMLEKSITAIRRFL
ncbi:MAG: sugar phosphate isomerase/epimerase [Deltaproteobacteria bacterium]|nr:sugar phosphate isomerase/epimerase [Deltaproteobacteria bacterium]